MGRAVGLALAERGDRVVAVSRGKAELPFSAEMISWEDLGSVGEVDAVVHLAGENVGQRWTEATKRKILESRVTTAQKLRAGLKKAPPVFVSASGIGYFGDRGDEVLVEESSPGRDFLAEVCVAWERAALAFQTRGSRVVILRFGLVMGAGGGALAKMSLPFRLGLGGRLGDGQQWAPWVHLDDVVALILRAIDDGKMENIYNAVAPELVRNDEFSRQLAKAFGKRTFLPVPAFALKAALGEMSSALLGGQRAQPKRLADLGFSYKYPKLFAALRASVE